VPWFTNEVLTNMSTYPSNLAFKCAFWLTGSGPGLNVNKLAGLAIGMKKAPTKAFFLEQMAADKPTRLIPCHGDVLNAADLPAQITKVLNARL
jgi:hypothetical protein